MTARRRIAVLLSLSVVALAGCGSDDTEGTDETPTSSPSSPESTPTSASPSSEPSQDPSDEPSKPTSSATPSESASVAPGSVTVPVYFTGATPQGTRLYREFRRVEGDDPAEAAVDLMTSGDALDPDYGTLFPSGSFDEVDIEADPISVELRDDSWTTRARGMTRAEARLALQQLVYTVQGVAQARTPVEVELDDQPARLFGIDTTGGVRNAPELEVRALVNVTTPAEGQTVSGSFVATGVSSSFEATIAWEVRRGGADGAIVRRGSAMARGWLEKLYPWRTTVRVGRLAPGDYTFVARTDDPTSGEGPGPTEDTKSIVVA